MAVKLYEQAADYTIGRFSSRKTSNSQFFGYIYIYIHTYTNHRYFNAKRDGKL